MQKLFIVAVMLVVAGCATTKQWTATGGSRADGVVRLSYEFGEFETPQLNEQQGTALAAQRCHTWGYSGAEAFGGSTRQCLQRGGFNDCATWQVTKEYQCTGTGNQAVGNMVAPERPGRISSADARVPQPAPASLTQTVLAAQRTSSRLGCGDVRSAGTTDLFVTSCSDHDVVIECEGGKCDPVRAVRSDH